MNDSVSILWKACVRFIRFAPKRQAALIGLLLLQGVTTGVGLLMIVPLLQVIGIETSGEVGRGSSAALKAIEWIGIEPTLGLMLIVYVGVVALVATVRYSVASLAASLQFGYISYNRDSLFRSLLRAKWEFIVTRRMSDFSHVLSSQVQAIGQASYLMVNFISQLVLASVMMALAFFASWQLALVAIAMGGILLVMLLPINRIVYGSGRLQLIGYKSVFQLLTEQLGCLKMIKGFGDEEAYAERLYRAGSTVETQSARVLRLNALTQWVYVTGAVVAFAVFFYLSQTRFSVSLVTVILLLVIFSRLLPQLSSIQKTYQQLVHKVPAFRDVEEMKRECDAACEAGDPVDVGPVFDREVSIENVSYRYPGREDFALRHVTACIEKNKTTALVGPSGSGKSTLADLVAGLLEPTCGEIRCDGVALTAESRRAWRRSVAYVTQEVFLFHDTIRANLEWVAPVPPAEEAIWHALKLAAADEFVARLPDGLDTIVGDRGIRLSGGERQRIALARALLAKAQLLILDEATSALDLESERQIQRALEGLRGKATLLVIAHRETTIQMADTRIELLDSRTEGANRFASEEGASD
ncbi:ABC transporter ATP-binding protein [Pelagicoccus sp. SDUM812003]|nr:ABC transporter ATP-binding protein [Pelagicoccus sp. SDUM812003]